MKRSCEKLKFLAIFTPLIIMIFGCSMSQINSNIADNYTLPDYHKPESQFVPLDFFTMTSDFIMITKASILFLKDIIAV